MNVLVLLGIAVKINLLGILLEKQCMEVTSRNSFLTAEVERLGVSFCLAASSLLEGVLGVLGLSILQVKLIKIFKNYAN